MQRNEYLAIDGIAQVLAVVMAEQGHFTYADKLSNAQTKDLAFLYIKEVMRDFASLRNKGDFENKEAEKEANQVDMGKVESELDQFWKGIEETDRKKLREILSIIAAKSIARAEYLSTRASKEKADNQQSQQSKADNQQTQQAEEGGIKRNE